MLDELIGYIIQRNPVGCSTIDEKNAYGLLYAIIYTIIIVKSSLSNINLMKNLIKTYFY